MNPATNAAAMAMITTQTQIEALASFLSSISVTSFAAIQMPIERETHCKHIYALFTGNDLFLQNKPGQHEHSDSNSCK